MEFRDLDSYTKDAAYTKGVEQDTANGCVTS
jgi:hypothetical protein